jgi:hypothetical protein
MFVIIYCVPKLNLVSIEKMENSVDASPAKQPRLEAEPPRLLEVVPICWILTLPDSVLVYLFFYSNSS